MSLTRSLLPRSLRSRLILSFGILIFLSLFLAGTTTVYLLKAEREKTAREKIGRLATTIGLRSAFLEASGAGSNMNVIVQLANHGRRLAARHDDGKQG